MSGKVGVIVVPSLTPLLALSDALFSRASRIRTKKPVDPDAAPAAVSALLEGASSAVLFAVIDDTRSFDAHRSSEGRIPSKYNIGRGRDGEKKFVVPIAPASIFLVSPALNIRLCANIGYVDSHRAAGAGRTNCLACTLSSETACCVAARPVEMPANMLAKPCGGTGNRCMHQRRR